jgi:acrylyl-CoA reductase (NADPH)
MDTTFKALVVDQVEGKSVPAVKELHVSDLPAGEVLVAIDYSSMNYKDAMALSGLGKIIRSFPMVPGIDFAGTVVDSSSPAYRAGDHVVLTGWSVGERYWGGYSQMARVKADWLVHLPPSLSSQSAMAIGTAGLTAMLCVMALEDAGIKNGKILVSGANGGVGSVAISLLARRGYEVTALTQRPDENRDYLMGLGAQDVIGGPEWKDKPAPLGTQRWQGAVDVVGGTVLARMLSEIDYGGAVAACGLAGGFGLDTTVMPFILRGVRLWGVDSVMCPLDRRNAAWERLAAEFGADAQQQMERVVGLADVVPLAAAFMAGTSRGRVVVDVNR